eukprot:239096-Prymnesium_polylepis.1
MDGAVPAAPTNYTAARAAAMRPGPHSCRSLNLRRRKRTQSESRLRASESRAATVTAVAMAAIATEA